MLRSFVILFVFTSLASAQSIGAPYGTRDPHTCPSTKEPAKGAITPDKAKLYVQCSYEGEHKNADELWLLDVQQVEVGRPRPFEIRADSSEADPKEMVYPIRGHQVKYMCHQFKNGYPRDKNCYYYDEADATGSCFRTSFGDWKCHMEGHGSQQKGPGPTR